jgi:membrane protein involved in colicin uptake
MKKLAIAVAALIVLIAFASWNVWHAVYEPVTSTPGLVEQGRQQLHAQLEQAKTREAEIEKQDWDTVTLLRELIQAHQHRIDQLKDNGQAGEIVAHDREAIDRLEKRIADLQAQQAALPAVQSDETAAADSPQAAASGGASVAPHPVAPQATKPQGAPAPKTPSAAASSSVSPHSVAPQTPKPAPKPAVPASPKPAAPQAQPQTR